MLGLGAVSVWFAVWAAERPNVSGGRAMSERAENRALPPARHETADVAFRLGAGLLALSGGLLVLLIGVAWLMFPRDVKDARFAQPFPAWPKPALQTDPARRHAAVSRRGTAMARTAPAGRDRAAGTVHIPIDQAMRAVAAEGIPGWPTGDATVSQGDRR